MPPTVRLEIIFRRLGTAISVALEITPPCGTTAAQLAEGTLPLLDDDFQRFRAAALDANSYGRLLTDTLFSDQRLLAGYREARALASGAAADLQIRLRIPINEHNLQGLRWELLQDPLDGHLPLALSERISCSRILDSPDLTPAAPRLLELPSSVVAVVCPRGPDRYGLTPFNVTAERDLFARALANLPARYLCSDDQPVTITRITDTLREGTDLFCLVCHGALVDGVAYLYLEGDDGAAEAVDAAALVRAFQGLAARPPV